MALADVRLPRATLCPTRARLRLALTNVGLDRQTWAWIDKSGLGSTRLRLARATLRPPLARLRPPLTNVGPDRQNKIPNREIPFAGFATRLTALAREKTTLTAPIARPAAPRTRSEIEMTPLAAPST